MKKVLITFSILMVVTFGLKNAYSTGGLVNPPKANAGITGQVHDGSTGESLAGVAVSLEGSDLKTYTDLDGDFEFKGILPGKYNLVFSFISYNKSLVENLEVKDNGTETIEVKLQEAK